MQIRKQLEDSIREQIIKKFQSGKGPQKIADEIDLNVNTVSSVIRLFKQSGRIGAKKTRAPRQKKISLDAMSVLTEAISADVSVPLKTLKEKLNDQLGVSACLATISNSLRGMNYSLKKVSLIPESRNTEENKNLREAYCLDYMLQDEEKLIFVDEFGVCCSTRLGYGRSIVGTPARKNVRAIRSKNISVCAAVMKTGVKYFKFSDSPYNSLKFLDFLKELVRQLNEENIYSGRIIMDNASIHKNEDQRSFLEENGFELKFLPAYSPQLNPIEEVFSKWKHYIAQQNSSSINELYSSINSSASLISVSDCVGFYRHVRSFVLKGIRKEDF